MCVILKLSYGAPKVRQSLITVVMWGLERRGLCLLLSNGSSNIRNTLLYIKLYSGKRLLFFEGEGRGEKEKKKERTLHETTQ